MRDTQGPWPLWPRVLFLMQPGPGAGAWSLVLEPGPWCWSRGSQRVPRGQLISPGCFWREPGLCVVVLTRVTRNWPSRDSAGIQLTLKLTSSKQGGKHEA